MPRAPMRLPAVPPPPAAAAVGEGERPARAAGSLGVRLEQRSPGRGERLCSRGTQKLSSCSADRLGLTLWTR